MKELTKSFTDKVKEALEIKSPSEGDDFVYSNISSEQLIKISSMIPKRNLKDRQNEAPTFEDFLNFANECKQAVFEIYICGKRRDDERVTVDGVRFPTKLLEPAKTTLLTNALDGPSEHHTKKGITRFWWD